MKAKAAKGWRVMALVSRVRLPRQRSVFRRRRPCRPRAAGACK
jgi:hypothetical protein